MLNKCGCDEQGCSPFCCGENSEKHAFHWKGSVERADGFCWQLAAPCRVLEPGSWPPGRTRWAVWKGWSLCTQRLPNVGWRLPPPQPGVRAPPPHSKNRRRKLRDCLPQLLNQDLDFAFLLTASQPPAVCRLRSSYFHSQHNPSQRRLEWAPLRGRRSPTRSVPPGRRLSLD